MKKSLGLQITSGFVLVIILFIVAGLISYLNLKRLERDADWVEHTHMVLELIESVLGDLKDAQRGQRGYIITGNENYLEPYGLALTQLSSDIEELQQLTFDNAGQQERISKIKPLITENLEHLDKTIKLRRDAGFDKAREVIVTNFGKVTLDTISSIFNEMTLEENRLMEERRARSNKASKVALLGIILMSFVAISIILILINSFRKITGKLDRQNREIQEGVNVLSSAVSEIATTASQLAVSSAETSSSITETTTTLEELKQTAQMASEKAKEISESSKRTLQVTEDGEKAVEETSLGMSGIQEQMESIADNIIRLSEQSQSIAEIMNLINDLAEQSNLLAVNASIEAAKAGEEGKGFTVVADEVKSLSEQSKQATKQVREILTDIQKAISNATMASEEGTKVVEAGLKQSGEARIAIKSLADVIEESTQTNSQIIVSVQQQFVGIDQVTGAIRNISDSSTQNMDNIKQLEASSKGLEELGIKLKELVIRR